MPPVYIMTSFAVISLKVGEIMSQLITKKWKISL
jgi:hypothetical protein